MKVPNRLHTVFTSRWWIPAMIVGGMWIVGCDHDHHDYDDHGRPAAYHEEGWHDHDGDRDHRVYEHHDRD
ncbi:MAG: hypothetical protein JWN24_261 [Phycisphaerales bacterium]|nr:hypothetical protein [Phycisphaerales bacterium]